jgi:hypothetical protein
MRVLEQKLAVDEEFAEENARPPTEPEGIKHRDAEPDRWPDGGHGCRVPERLPQLGGAEVKGAERDDSEEIAQRGTPKGDPRRVCSELSWS